MATLTTPVPTADSIAAKQVAITVPGGAQALNATGSTITVTGGVVRLSAAAPVTASTLAAASYSGQEISVINESANSVAITAGVSPASVTLAAGAAAKFIWDDQAATPAWYHYA